MAETNDTRGTSPLDNMTWLAGHWRGEAFGGTCEESWNPQSAGTMVGTFKHIADGKVNFYEIMTIGPVTDGYALKVKHFNADLTAWEEKSEWSLFSFLETTDEEIRFDGLVYKRLSEDTMQIVLRMTSKDGSTHNEIIDCQRVK